MVVMGVRERQKERRRVASVGDRHIYYWIKAIVDGRLYCAGPWVTKEEAWQAGFRTLDVNYEVVELQTKNQNEATRMLKYSYLEETRNVRKSTRNARHTLGAKNGS